MIRAYDAVFLHMRNFQTGLSTERYYSPVSHAKRVFSLHRNTVASAILHDHRIVKITVVAAQHVGRTTFRGLHHVEVIRIAQRRKIWLAQHNALRDLPQEIGVI